MSELAWDPEVTYPSLYWFLGVFFPFFRLLFSEKPKVTIGCLVYTGPRPLPSLSEWTGGQSSIKSQGGSIPSAVPQVPVLGDSKLTIQIVESTWPLLR